jgi:hypothetical protein
MNEVKKALPYAAIIVFLATLLFSFGRYLFERPGDRRVFYFESLDTNKISTEVRFLPSKPVQGKEKIFVDELLLGPMTNRFRPLFSPGTKADFCFVRGRTMYVGLSKEAVQITPETADIKKGMELFKKNILKNFTNIDTIVMYIDGIGV